MSSEMMITADSGRDMVRSEMNAVVISGRDPGAVSPSEQLLERLQLPRLTRALQAHRLQAVLQNLHLPF